MAGGKKKKGTGKKKAAAARKKAGKKRAATASGEEDRGAKRGAGGGKREAGNEEDELEFEDPYGDELVEEEAAAGDEEAKEEDEEAAGDAAAQDRAMEAADGSDKPRVWRPGDRLEEGEELDWDSSAYTAYHKLRLDWPSLSFDVIRDHLGDFRTRFPLTSYLAVGSQADRAENNVVRILKVSEMHKTKHDGGNESDGDDDDDPNDLDDDPILEEKSFPHRGGVNRIRSMPQNPHLLATMADTGRVHVWNVLELLKSLDAPPARLPATPEPVFTFDGHAEEGFAVDWSPVQPGRLVTGDCARFMHVWNPSESSWVVDRLPYLGHTASVEDLQWSPSQPDVFASCSVDRTVRVWDTRTRERAKLFVAAHLEDVNVISWNHRTAYLLCSGSDDGSFKIWDLRMFRSDSHAAHFKWHKGPITSVEWHPVEESVLAVSSADHSTTVWDMALEGDEGPAAGAQLGDVQLPPQLLFEHLGQKDVKEVHWHPQIPSLLVTTARDGLDMFKPANMQEAPQPSGTAVNA